MNTSPFKSREKSTRRDITLQKITSNILRYNSPVAAKDFSALKLCPQVPSSFTIKKKQLLPNLN